jgi:hypothetical protein
VSNPLSPLEDARRERDEAQAQAQLWARRAWIVGLVGVLVGLFGPEAIAPLLRWLLGAV